MQDRNRATSHLTVVPSARAVQPKAGTLLRKRLAAEATSEPGLGECSQLCDVEQMERVGALVVDAFTVARLGGNSGLSQPLNALLVGPLRRSLPTLNLPQAKGRGRGVRTELAPTIALIKAAEEVIRRIDAGPWDAKRAADTAAQLRYAWAIWIAYIASYWLTFEVPLRLVQQQASRELGARGGRAPKSGQQRSTSKAATIVAKYIELMAKMESNRVAGAVALQFEVTPQYVGQVWRNHLAKKNTKQQASL